MESERKSFKLVKVPEESLPIETTGVPRATESEAHELSDDQE